MIPMQRPGTADEIAEAVLWLLSDAAAYTTGALLVGVCNQWCWLLPEVPRY
jgi:NAD(P)-dependent dehydrogenase (short-subunit alcohol dehydrogenase family)